MAGKKPPQAPKANPGFLGPKPSRVVPATQYDEQQQDEVTALEAIYGDDFVKHETVQGVWKKKSEPGFDIRVKAWSDEEVVITLGVVLTATYPKTPPLLSLKSHSQDGLRESTLFRIQKYIETQPKVLVAKEEVMIQDLVEGIREILEGAAMAKSQGRELPSLEEERQAHDALLAQMAKEEKRTEEQKKEEEAREEQRALGALVEQERERQRTKAKESRKKHRSNASPERGVPGEDAEAAIILDEPCGLTDSTGNTVYFNTLTDRTIFRRGPVSTVYMVRPVLSGGLDRRFLALKQTRLHASGEKSVQVLKDIQSLESELRVLKKLRHQKHHRNILDVLDFKIDRVPQAGGLGEPATWTVSVLTSFAFKESLLDILGRSGILDVGKARGWTRELLDALEYLHGHRICHQDIHAGNVFLVEDPSGGIIPKLADMAYQNALHTICAELGTAAKPVKTWVSPEVAIDAASQYKQKTDVWDLGVVFLQMLFGVDTPQKYRSPKDFMNSHNLSGPLEELLMKFFATDPRRRPRAFDLGASEFLATDAPIMDEDSSALVGSLVSLPQLTAPRSRHDSVHQPPVVSRYREDFVEEGRLGKGGFGEVVKARKKLDGQVYAIKKITTSEDSTVSDTLKEVQLLSKLSHPAVVRYYNTWLEKLPGQSGAHTQSESSTEAASTEYSTDALNVDFTRSGDLDFMSSAGPNIVFGYETDDEAAVAAEEEDEEEEHDDSEDESGTETGSEDDSESGDGRPANAPRQLRARRNSHKAHSTMIYISMEYCEKRTLRDLITRNLSTDVPEVWRLFRQILGGLVHIHGLGIVHRDLKPDNVFIQVGEDGVNNVKIGDFGLATTGQLATVTGTNAQQDAGDETRSVGTSFYVAPEVRSGGGGSYTAKVDMYSLGVMFFEMSHPPMMNMERVIVMQKLRGNPPTLPADFKTKEKAQPDVVLCLVTHSPQERPSAAELLHSGKLPVPIESETIRRALAALSDPSTPYFEKMLSMLFARPTEQAKDYVWDISSHTPSPEELMRQHFIKDTLVSVFRRHGAVETPPTLVYPASTLYGDDDKRIVRILGTDGALLQLPFDLRVGNARSLARNPNAAVIPKCYSFGNVFRERPGGGQPNMLSAVEFDIVTKDKRDKTLKEAEVIKVLDEIIASFPNLYLHQKLFFQLGHSDLLQLVFDFCGVETGARRAVSEQLSRLNQMSWQRVRADLRAPLVGASSTSLDELQRFDFRETPTKAFTKLKALFKGTDLYQRASPVIAHLKEVAEYCKRFGVTTKVYISPLNTWNEASFSGGIMFSCIAEKKDSREVVAAGGRYDGLINDLRPKIGGQFPERHAVGFSMNWVQLSRASKVGRKASSKRGVEDEDKTALAVKRCDVLVASFDPETLRTSGLEVVTSLWAQDISAELADDARSVEELLSRNRDDSTHACLVIVKQGLLKVKALSGKKEVPEVDLRPSQLISWLRNEVFRERGFAKSRAHNASELSNPSGARPDVKVLVSDSKTKKTNRSLVTEQARAFATKLTDAQREAGILAVETTDAALDLIRCTTLSNPESWRRAEQGVNPDAKKYIGQVRAELTAWRDKVRDKEGTASTHVLVYSFWTGNGFYYDLEA